MSAETRHHLTIESVHVDGSMVELETSFCSKHWSGRATAYTQFDDVADFSERLARFAESLDGEVTFTAGRESTPIGFLRLCFQVVSRTGRMRCHLQLATSAATEHRAEEVWRSSVELTADVSALDSFIAGLRRIASIQEGKAVMNLNEYVAH